MIITPLEIPFKKLLIGMFKAKKLLWSDDHMVQKSTITKISAFLF